jgi:ketosteroid isomerase-like protein
MKVYRGHAGARQAWESFKGNVQLRVRFDDIRDLGESVLARGEMQTTGQTTQLVFNGEVAHSPSFATARWSVSEISGATPTPSKPPGCGSRRSRGKTSRPSVRCSSDGSTGGGGVEAVPVEVLAEDVEWDQSGYPLIDFPDRGVGRDNLLDALGRYFSGWTNYQPAAREFIDAGENVVVVLHEEASIGDSGVSVERDLFLVWTIRDGLVVKYRSFETREEALEAAGLRE